MFGNPQWSQSCQRCPNRLLVDAPDAPTITSTSSMPPTGRQSHAHNTANSGSGELSLHHVGPIMKSSRNPNPSRFYVSLGTPSNLPICEFGELDKRNPTCHRHTVLLVPVRGQPHPVPHSAGRVCHAGSTAFKGTLPCCARLLLRRAKQAPHHHPCALRILRSIADPGRYPLAGDEEAAACCGWVSKTLEAHRTSFRRC